MMNKAIIINCCTLAGSFESYLCSSWRGKGASASSCGSSSGLWPLSLHQAMKTC